MGTPSANYTVADQDFDIPVDETEPTDPTEFLIKALKALENHTHASTRGAPVARLAASVASAAGVTLTGGGLTISTGGLTVTAGGVTVTAGGVTVNGGSLALTANTLHSITGGGALALGTTPALSGTVRLPNAVNVSWRNGANTGDDSITFDASDRIQLVCVTEAATATAGGNTLPANPTGF